MSSSHFLRNGPARRVLASWGLGLALLSLPGLAVATQPDTSGQLQVSATASHEVMPDRATINATLQEISRYRDFQESADDGDLATARQRLEQRATALVDALRELGVEAEQLRAGSLTVRDVQHIERRADNGQRRLRATEFSRPVLVTLYDLDLVAEVIDALMAEQANLVGGVSYDLQDRQAAERNALAAAVANAKADATVMAEGLGVSLGRVMEVSRGGASVRPPQPVMSQRSMMLESSDAGSAPIYTMGEITLHASATVIWEIDGP